MPTSIAHNNLLSRALPMLLLGQKIIGGGPSLTQLMGGLILTVSLLSLVHNSIAQAASLTQSNIMPTTSGQTVQMADSAPLRFPTDGVYLYGQSPEAGQIGSAYIVFEARDAMVVGALYMPYSSFDCFYGDIEANQLAMTVIGSYDQEAYPYSIAIRQDSTVVDASGGGATNDLKLEGFHQIDVLGEVDQHVLGVCRAEHHDQVW